MFLTYHKSFHQKTVIWKKEKNRIKACHFLLSTFLKSGNKSNSFLNCLHGSSSNRSYLRNLILAWWSSPGSVGWDGLQAQISKMESTLFVPENLSFSEYLRCLNFPLWKFWPAKTKQVKESNLFWDKAPTRSGRYKHLKFSENDKFSGTIVLIPF